MFGAVRVVGVVAVAGVVSVVSVVLCSWCRCCSLMYLLSVPYFGVVVVAYMPSLPDMTTISQSPTRVIKSSAENRVMSFAVL